jgi:hypothetical protein
MSHSRKRYEGGGGPARGNYVGGPSQQGKKESKKKRVRMAK